MHTIFDMLQTLGQKPSCPFRMLFILILILMELNVPRLLLDSVLLGGCLVGNNPLPSFRITWRSNITLSGNERQI